MRPYPKPVVEMPTAVPIVIPSVPAEEPAYNPVKAARELQRNNDRARESKGAKLEQFREATRKRASKGPAHIRSGSGAALLDAVEVGAGAAKTKTEFELSVERAQTEAATAYTLLGMCM